MKENAQSLNGEKFDKRRIPLKSLKNKEHQ